MLVIGDVTGRGAQAASITAQRPLHAAHRRGADRRPGGRAGDPQPRPARPRATRRSAASPRWRSARTRASRCGCAVAGHPPPLLVDGEDGGRGAGGGSGARRLRGRQLGDRAHSSVEPGQQLVVVTDGITEAAGPEGRFGEERLRARARAAPAARRMAVQRLEGALHAFTEGQRSTTTRAILAISPPDRGGPARCRVRSTSCLTSTGAGRAPLRRLQPPRPRRDRVCMRDGVLRVPRSGVGSLAVRAADLRVRRRSGPARAASPRRAASRRAAAAALPARRIWNPRQEVSGSEAASISAQAFLVRRRRRGAQPRARVGPDRASSDLLRDLQQPLHLVVEQQRTTSPSPASRSTAARPHDQRDPVESMNSQAERSIPVDARVEALQLGPCQVELPVP